MTPQHKVAAPKPIAVHDRLLKALNEVDRPGNFCTYGSRPMVMPGLEVDKMGIVGLPLTKTHARKLIKLCRQAPYGKGTETVVDTDVRRVWELDPAQFKLTNPKWDELRLAVTLEHRYTQDGLTIDKLKGVDRAQAEVLFEAAHQADCVAHLAFCEYFCAHKLVEAN